MAKLQQVIMKLVENNPNASFSPATKSILQDRLNQLLSQFHTPDHPPYAAMIERALRELNEKRGSSEDSISKFIEKEYNDLPLAHSTLLKHHFGKLCESGDILTQGQRYMLPNPSSIPSLNSSTGPKRKPRKRKWGWDWDMERNKRHKKKHKSQQKNRPKGGAVEVTREYKEYDALTNHSSENCIFVEEKQKDEDNRERQVREVERNRWQHKHKSELKNQPKGDEVVEVSGEHEESEGLRNYSNENRVSGKEKQKEEDKGVRLLSSGIGENDDGFDPSMLKFDEKKYMEGKPQQQEVDNAEDNRPELSRQKFKDLSDLGVCSTNDSGAQECPILVETKDLLYLDISSEKLVSAERPTELEPSKLESMSLVHSHNFECHGDYDHIKQLNYQPAGVLQVQEMVTEKTSLKYEQEKQELLNSDGQDEVLSVLDSELETKSKKGMKHPERKKKPQKKRMITELVSQTMPALSLVRINSTQSTEQQKSSILALQRPTQQVQSQRSPRQRHCRKQHEHELKISKTVGMDAVSSLVNETERQGPKRPVRKRKTMSQQEIIIFEGDGHNLLF